MRGGGAICRPFPLAAQKDQNIERRQTLFMFLRPTILRTKSDVSAMSNDRRQRLKAIESSPADKGTLLDDRQTGAPLCRSRLKAVLARDIHRTAFLAPRLVVTVV